MSTAPKEAAPKSNTNSTKRKNDPMKDAVPDDQPGYSESDEYYHSYHDEGARQFDSRSRAEPGSRKPIDVSKINIEDFLKLQPKREHYATPMDMYLGGEGRSEDSSGFLIGKGPKE